MSRPEPEATACLFDTHAHFEGTADGIRAVLERAKAAGVSAVAAIGGGTEANEGAEIARAMAAGGDGSLPAVFKATGFDREYALRNVPDPDLAGASALGEIGLDYHFGDADRKEQIALFERQLDLARRCGLPVVIHTRDADEDTLAVLREIPSRGIIHSFTGSVPFCKSLLDLGFFISISGIATFKSADNVRETAMTVPDDRLLVETDSPYLAPVPVRGRPNEPAFVAHTARFLANLRSTPFEAFAALTTANAMKVFAPA